MASRKTGRRPVMGVIGAGTITDPAVTIACEALGRGAVTRGFRVVTGGLGGVMEAVSRGARQSHAYREGDTIGIVRGYDADAANAHVDIVIPTGMELARNLLVVSTADVVVAVSGGSGTLSEVALAWQLGKPILTLAWTGGWAARVAGTALDGRREDTIIGCDSVSATLTAASTRVIWPT